MIKFNSEDLEAKIYRKSWFQLQKIKTRYPFVNICLELSSEVLDNFTCLKLFKGENLKAVEFKNIQFETRENGKFTVKNKEILMSLSEYIEQSYMILVKINNA